MPVGDSTVVLSTLLHAAFVCIFKLKEEEQVAEIELGIPMENIKMKFLKLVIRL